jgi:hypothetical protein
MQDKRSDYGIRETVRICYRVIACTVGSDVSDGGCVSTPIGVSPLGFGLSLVGDKLGFTAQSNPDMEHDSVIMEPQGSVHPIHVYTHTGSDSITTLIVKFSTVRMMQ